MLLKKRIPLKYIVGKIKIELALVVAYTIGFEVIHPLFVDLYVMHGRYRQVLLY